MSKLPVVSAHECVKVLEQVGFEVSRQTGSHINMRRDDPYCKVVVPNHNEIKKERSAALSAMQVYRLMSLSNF